MISLGSGLEATFGSSLGLAALRSVLAGAGLLDALVLLTPLASALGLAGVLVMSLPLGSGLAGAFADLLVDFDGVLGIGLEVVLTGDLAAGLVAGLDFDTTVVFGMLLGFLAGLVVLLLGLAAFRKCLAGGFVALCGATFFAAGLPLVATLTMGLGADLL